MTNFLATAKEFSYSSENGTPEVGNYKPLNELLIDGLNVTIDISGDADKIGAIQNKPAVAPGTATGLYVMNTFARYLGALNYADSGNTVAKIIYKGTGYTWEQTATNTYLKGSNWRTAQGDTTLVSVITADVANLEADDTLTMTLVDANNHSVDVKFALKTE
ncbi:hypothetical protein DV702_16520 [Sporosarcina sp. PTS2304]|uniref:hypothetical protein n=1 Tax=Sporosarcina sp. PTS2304 TaxID=2283194 RepID=UPI000E0D00FA|nr:hypothetical protein [Sporosarcina sp. PTS2304]AXI01184.1 hypothetical protein DV702_16520 [Sporosarcina sp. PTS2304]